MRWTEYNEGDSNGNSNPTGSKCWSMCSFIISKTFIFNYPVAMLKWWNSQTVERIQQQRNCNRKWKKLIIICEVICVFFFFDSMKCVIMQSQIHFGWMMTKTKWNEEKKLFYLVIGIWGCGLGDTRNWFHRHKIQARKFMRKAKLAH